MSITPDRSLSTLGWLLHGVGLTCAIALLVAYGYLVGGPLADHRQLCQQKVTQLEELMKKVPQVRQENAALLAELVSLQQSVDETQRRLPPELREQEFIEEVRRVASQADVEMRNSHVGSITEHQSYSQAELTFECIGSYASICRFLNEIDHFTRITEIANLQIEVGDNFHSYPLQVTFVLYFGKSTHDRHMRGDVL